jgi:hypothetical protein
MPKTSMTSLNMTNGQYPLDVEEAFDLEKGNTFFLMGLGSTVDSTGRLLFDQLQPALDNLVARRYMTA